MAINNFKPFALDPNANVTSQADWEALPALLSGFTAGKASSAQVNKAIRQASFIAAALAQYTANKSGLDVLDDGDLNGFISKMGTAFGKDFQALDATLSALAGLATGANKLPYFTGNDTAAQTDLTSVGRDIIGKNTIADILTYLQLRESFCGVVGQSRNARMSVTSASASAAFTADELIVETATKQQYRLSSVNKTVNLGTTGEGGMDTGTVPASGFVGLYVIYNPTTDTSAMLAVNATSASAPEIYGGANMPAGYTASALVSVWRVSSGQFTIGIQRGRKITISPHMVLASSISAASYTSLDISSCVPRNAQSVDGSVNPNITGTGSNTNISVASLVDGTGSVSIGCGGAAINAPFSDIQIATAQTIYYTLTASTALQTSYIYIRGYEI